MKYYISILFCLILSTSWAIDTLQIDSKIESVKVFYSGAQIFRTASQNIISGTHFIEFNNLPFNLDEKTIKVTPPKGIQIQSVQYLIEYPEGLNSKEEEIRNDALQIEKAIELIGAQKQGLIIESNTLSLNQDFRTRNSISVEKLSTASEYYSSRIGEIKNEIMLLELKVDSLNKVNNKQQVSQNRVINQLRQPKGKILIKIMVEKNTKAPFEISYFSDQAQWVPEYSFKVNSIAEPLEIIYKAKVLQNTKEDWNNVKIELSEVDPRENKTCPELKPWVLENGQSKPRPGQHRVSNKSGSTGISGLVLDESSGEPIPFANVVIEQNSVMVTGTSTDFDGKFSIKPLSPGNYTVKFSSLGYDNKAIEAVKVVSSNTTFIDANLSTNSVILNEVSVVSYSEPLIDARNVSSGTTVSGDVIRGTQSRGSTGRSYKTSSKNYSKQGVTSSHIQHNLKQNITHIEYEIESPYSIPSTGQEYTLTIKSTSVPVDYKYYAVPKIEQIAYLTAKVENWSQLKLLSGNARIFYQGSFVGETHIDRKKMDKEYFISLGKDENIRIVREMNTEKSLTRVNGSTVKNDVYYDFKIINKTSSPISLEIVDQLPITRYREIKIEYIATENVKWNSKNGILKWNYEIEAEELTVKGYFYKIQYSKNIVY